MAYFNGTQNADTISGTIDDDIITGIGGGDVINGAAGNDSIDGGAGADDIIGGEGNDQILGGDGNDAIDGEAGDDQIDGGAGADVILGGEGDDTVTIVSGEGTNDSIDGGDGTDTLIAELVGGDDIDGPADNGLAAIIGGEALVSLTNFEFLQVSNASDLVLDLAANAVFGPDLELVSADGLATGVTDAALLGYTASTGLVAADATADEDEGVIIDGTTYMNGAPYETADGGSVEITWALGVWSFDYTPDAADTLAVGDAVESSDDIVTTFVATITNVDGSTVDVTVNAALNLDEDIDANAELAGVTTHGDTQMNEFIGSDFDDVFWAGADDAAADDLSGGLGNDTLAGGGGADALYGEDGDDTIYAGAGDDDNVLGGAGNDTIWAGEGDDGDALLFDGGDGDDVMGGGDGNDVMNGGADNDTLYGGKDDEGTDDLRGDAGDDILFGGNGDDVLAGGADNDTLYGGADDDNLTGGAGDDTLYGGAGDDTFIFDGADAGLDTIGGFEFGAAPGEGDVLDLTVAGFDNIFGDSQDVINAMTDNGTDTILALGAGQTVTLLGVTVSDFQSATDDWVLV